MNQRNHLEINFKKHNKMTRILFVILNFFFLTQVYSNIAEVQMKNDSLLINKTKLIIGFCNKSDSVELKKLLNIKTINNNKANNDDFIKMVWSFNEIAKNNKIFSTFFEDPNKYCYQNISKTFVLLVGRDTNVFEFDKSGKLIGIYFCIRR